MQPPTITSFCRNLNKQLHINFTATTLFFKNGKQSDLNCVCHENQWTLRGYMVTTKLQNIYHLRCKENVSNQHFMEFEWFMYVGCTGMVYFWWHFVIAHESFLIFGYNGSHNCKQSDSCSLSLFGVPITQSMHDQDGFKQYQWIICIHYKSFVFFWRCDQNAVRSASFPSSSAFPKISLQYAGG